MINFRIVAATALIVFLGAPVQAQTVYHNDVPPGDATPSGASFSVLFPVPFSDVELKAEDPPHPTAIVRMVTGTGPDGIRFTATETPFMAGVVPTPMEDFMEGTKSRRDAEVTDANRGQTGDLQMLSFTLTDFSGGTFFRLIRDSRAQYMLVVQFPLVQRGQATAMKDDFFGSFKIITP